MEDVETFAGLVANVDDYVIDPSLARYNCRNNRLAGFALVQDQFTEKVTAAVARYGADRVAVVIGTSTSGIFETENAFYHRTGEQGNLPKPFIKNFDYTHNFFAPADFVSRQLGLTGPVLALSTACSSSAKAFVTAARYLELDLCDAAVVGGVDSICETTIRGFSSLELISKEPCRPFDTDRRGLSIGEAAAFALLERGDGSPVGARFIGYGESSDAHHMSTPHPEGEGARIAMAEALRIAGQPSDVVDYINMHGTATPVNDVTEARAVVNLFGQRVPVSSTKGWTGHTLGAAGALEAVISLITLQSGVMPGCLTTRTVDPAISANVLLENKIGPVTTVMTNSFGFGGNNCSLLFTRSGS
jgi:3-oxoacyl-[acyl-carrier-protein] synthase-1